MKLVTSALLVISLSACGGGNKTAKPPADDLDVEVEPPKPPGNPRNDLIPRSVLYGNPERANVQISPDGKWLSWVADLDGVMNVYVAPADDLTKAAPVTAEKVRPVRGVFWAFDGTHILYQQDEAGDENFHVMSVDLANGNAVTDLIPSAGARVEVMGVSHKKPSTVVLGVNDRDPQFFDLYAVDLATGTKKLLQQNDGHASFVLDEDLAVRFGVKPADDGSDVIERRDPKDKKKPWKPFDKVGIEDGFTTAIVGFDKKGTSYYAIDSRGRDTGALYKVDAKTKKKTLIAEDERVDMSPPLLHPTEATPQAVLIDYDKPVWRVLDKKLQPDFDAISAIQDGVWGIASRTLDDQVWIIGFDSDHQSPHYYRYDRATKASKFLFAVQPALDEQPLARMHPQVIPTRDGYELVSYLTLPNAADKDADGKADAPVPMVLMVHGGPWGRDVWGYDTVHQTLANRGYAVLSVNFRGSTGFGKQFLNAADLQWGKAMHDDLLDAVTWAVEQRVTPKDQICIMGGSYGGYATLVGVAMTPDVFACGVDIVGPSDLVTFQETIPAYWGPFIPVLKKRVGDPTTEEGRAMLKEASPLTHAGNIKVPLLIAQGQNDPRVNEAESRQIVEAMKAKKIPVSYVLFPDEGHGFARPENNIAFFAVAEAFLSVHLGGYYQPITQAEVEASSMQVVEGKEWLPGLPLRD